MRDCWCCSSLGYHGMYGAYGMGMNSAQRLALRSLLECSESPADAIRALGAFLAEASAGLESDAAGYVQESLAEAALHAEAAELDAEAAQ